MPFIQIIDLETDNFDEQPPTPPAEAAAKAESPGDICPPQDFDADSGGG